MASCASQGPPRPRDAAAPLASADWPRARAEASALLTKLIQVDTTNPPGNERAAAQLVGASLEAAGMKVELVAAGPGRASALARLPAASAARPPLVLLAHLDVPGADPAAWPVETPPFGGAQKDGAIWGRGALGTKGLVVLHAIALGLVARAGVALDRDVYLIAAADAEQGGHRGIEKIFEGRPDLLRAGLVLGEGGFTVFDPFGDGLTVHAVATGEKGFAALAVVAEGPSAPLRLVRALDRLGTAPPTRPVLTDPAIALLGTAASEMRFPASWIYRSPALTRTFALSSLASEPWIGSMVADEVTVHHLEAGDPAGGTLDRARATVFSSLLPGSSPGAMRAAIHRTIADTRVHVTISDGEEASASAVDPEVMSAIARRASRGGREVTVPALGPPRTDLRYFRRHGVPAYGWSPFAVSPLELATMRGRHEKLPIAELERGLEVMVGLILDLATPAGAADSPGPR